jgi:hypothetical protein
MMDASTVRKFVRESGQKQTIRIGYSWNSSGAGTSTPITYVLGAAAPQLVGKPYLSTTFRRGNFTKNLYTASTMEIVVGSEWIGE